MHGLTKYGTYIPPYCHKDAASVTNDAKEAVKPIGLIQIGSSLNTL